MINLFTMRIGVVKSLHTSSKRRIPAQGKPAWIGSAFAAISPTCLNLSNHSMTLSASSHNFILCFPPVKVHLLLSQTFCFSCAALNASSRAEAMSSVEGKRYPCIVTRSRSSRSCNARPKRSRPRVLVGHPLAGDVIWPVSDKGRAPRSDFSFRHDDRVPESPDDLGFERIGFAVSGEADGGWDSAAVLEREKILRSRCSRPRFSGRVTEPVVIALSDRLIEDGWLIC